MSYHIAKILAVGFGEATARKTDAFKKEEFGVPAEIDVGKAPKADDRSRIP